MSHIHSATAMSFDTATTLRKTPKLRPHSGRCFRPAVACSIWTYSRRATDKQDKPQVPRAAALPKWRQHEINPSVPKTVSLSCKIAPSEPRHMRLSRCFPEGPCTYLGLKRVCKGILRLQYILYVGTGSFGVHARVQDTNSAVDTMCNIPTHH